MVASELKTMYFPSLLKSNSLPAAATAEAEPMPELSALPFFASETTLVVWVVLSYR